MNYAAPVYITRLWWEIEAEGRAGRLEALAHQMLESLISSRRAACSARMKALRTRSEHGIARLIRESTA
jgi:hypothetical protein